jgi:hypothetical protein
MTNARTLSGLPRQGSGMSQILGVAVLIGPFEGSRWRGGCGGIMGFQWEAEAQGTSQDASPAIIRYLQPATLLNIQTWRFRSDVNDTFSVAYTYDFVGERSDEPTIPTLKCCRIST